MNKLIIWQTYHEDQQIKDYNLKENEIIKLVKGNCIPEKEEHINHLNRFYSEMTTLYWIYKNNIKSQYVGFCHYRRVFYIMSEFEPGECQVLKIDTLPCTIFQQYKSAHNYNDLYDIIEILNYKYGKENSYSEYLLKSRVFIPNCCFIMHYEDFTQLCDFLFPILFEYDNKNHLNMIPENYWNKTKQDFRFDNINYQCRTVSFLAERLISCYILLKMKPFCIQSIG